MSQIKPDEVQELLKVLKRKRDKKAKYNDDVLQFLDFYKIKRGRHKIRKSIIRQLYFNWSQNPLTSNELAQRFNEYFTIKGPCYLVNKNTLEITKDMYEALAKEKEKIKPLKHNDVLMFMKEYQIERGKFWTLEDIVYRLYKVWCEKRKKQKLSRKKFNIVLNLHLLKKINNKEAVYYGLSRDIMNEKEKTNA